MVLHCFHLQGRDTPDHCIFRTSHLLATGRVALYHVYNWIKKKKRQQSSVSEVHLSCMYDPLRCWMVSLRSAVFYISIYLMLWQNKDCRVSWKLCFSLNTWYHTVGRDSSKIALIKLCFSADWILTQLWISFIFLL